MSARFLDLHNAEAAPLARLSEVAEGDFREAILSAIDHGARLAAFFAAPAAAGAAGAAGAGVAGAGEAAGASDAGRAGAPHRLVAVLARENEGMLSLLSTTVSRSYRALTPECPQAHVFERDIHEQTGIVPEGHPWLKPLRERTSVDGFFQVSGGEIHEVAVGPVHAGVIEPGHFRFQCHGERVLHLEIALGYQHRGVERALAGGPGARTIHLIETLAGDTTAGHALAYCQAVEALALTHPPARAESLRGVVLELERLANHTGDLGALAGDVGFQPTASFCGRLRGEFLNVTALLCGSRLGRGMIRPGGVAFDLDDALLAEMERRLEAAGRDVQQAADLLLTNQSVIARFEDSGILAEDTCRELGLVGPPARACGFERDVRSSFPSGIYQFSQIPVSLWDTGDVFARAHVRRAEVQRSLAFVAEQLRALPAGPVRAPYAGTLAPGQIAVSLVEGWRGEICHAVITDSRGRFSTYKVVDPSMHNWSGLAVAMRDEAISDFPLCNKSFNLSYCGHDL